MHYNFFHDIPLMLFYGTKAGGQKGHATRLKKDPDYYSKIGVKGGQSSHKGGFASDKVGKDGLTGKERATKYGNQNKGKREDKI